MKIIELKTWPEYFDAVASGAKTFEIRYNDRDYQVGDTLVLHRYDPAKKEYTGESITRNVTYVLPLEDCPGLDVDRGTVALGLSPADKPKRKSISFPFAPTLRQRIAFAFYRVLELRIEVSPESEFSMYSAVIRPFRKKGE